MNEPLIEFNSPLVCWRAMHPMQFHKPQTLCNPSLISAVYATQMKICQGWWFVLTSYRSHQHNVRLQLGGLNARRRGKKGEKETAKWGEQCTVGGGKERREILREKDNVLHLVYTDCIDRCATNPFGCVVVDAFASL